ncbi:hypothetical protein X741_29265 [Mesorhizobium sp. LNHC229A00]|nr:hypothetical protein X741_29265 [Mesorhizobium sp. LNHC229A00]
MPRLPKTVQQQPYVGVGKAIADEEDRAAKCIRAKTHVQGRIEREAIEVVRFGKDERIILVEVALET